MSCFTGYIPLSGDTPSGLLITDLEGAPAELFTHLKQDADADGDAFYARFYKRSCDRFVEQVAKQLLTRFKVEEAIATGQAGTLLDTVNSTTEPWAGTRLDLYHSRYSLFYLESVAFWLETKGSDDVHIRVRTKYNDLLYNKTVDNDDLAAGLNEVLIEAELDYVDYVYVEIETDSDHDIRGTKLSTHGWEGEYRTAERIINGGGLQVNYSFICSVKAFVCAKLGQFKYALLNWLGVQLMEERILTDNINKFTTLSEEKAAELHGYYKKNFEDSLQPLVKRIKVTEDVLCFECSTAVTKRIMLP